MDNQGDGDGQGGLVPIAKAIDPYVRRLPKKAAAGVATMGISLTAYRFGPFTEYYQELAWSWACLAGAVASGYLILRPVFRMKD